MKQGMIPIILAFALVTLTSGARALDATSADNLAASILGQLGRTKGVAVVPNCGNGQLARALLAASTMKVLAMDADQTDLDAARGLIEPTGKIGLYCTIEKGSPSTMPFVDRFVDCIVITNVTDAGLSSIPYAEIERVLAPDGLAFIGRATAEGAGVAQAALQTWINAAAKVRSTAAVSVTSGTWAVITGQELRGIDIWPMHGRDASNSYYALDSVACFPWLPQAKMKPYHWSKGPGSSSSVGVTTVTSGGRVYSVATDALLLNMGDPVPMLHAYSIYNGELLWTRNVQNDNLGNLGGDPIRAYGRDVYLMRTSGGILQLNGITGAEIGTVSSVPSVPSNPPAPTRGGIGCAPYSASVWHVYGNQLAGWDFKNNRQGANHLSKVPCGVQPAPISNGIVVVPTPSCNCESGLFWGSHLQAPAGSYQFDRDAAADGSDRIERGAGTAGTLVPDSLDWPTHRSTVSRSGRSAAQVPTTAGSVRLMWAWDPPHNYITAPSTFLYDWLPEQEPTPPVVAGSYTFIGGCDGYVRCIDNRSGAQRWSFLTGGRIYATPTVAGGCVYVGSADGHAYCISADNGALVWRFRGAPSSMRTNLFGYLSSIWPVLSGVMVHNGNAYFAAGMQSEYGAHLYCVNARTGALVWQNNRGGQWLNAVERIGYSPCGYMTVGGSRVEAANGVGAHASFDMSSGAIDPVPAWLQINPNMLNGAAQVNNVSRGREVGVINNSILLTGGEITFRDHTRRWSTGYGQMHYFFARLNASGVAQYPRVVFASSVCVTPAWDGQDFYSCMRNGGESLERIAVSALGSALDAKAAEVASSSIPDRDKYANSDESNGRQSWWPAAQWTRTDITLNALALAPNAIVAAYTKPVVSNQIGSNWYPERATWYVGALDRASGNTLWEAALPDVGTNLKGEPLWQGLAIDRNGNVLVVQRNGNVLCYGSGQVSVIRNDRINQPVIPVASTGTERPMPVAQFHRASSFNSADAPMSSHAAIASIPSTSTVSDEIGSISGRTTPAISSATYDARTDSIDIQVIDGVAQHTVPPAERAAMYHPRDMKWRPDRACIPVVKVSGSSFPGNNHATNTIDCALTTRWAPRDNGKQWITYDLGKTAAVNAATMVWYASRKAHIGFTIEVSSDGTVFGFVDNGELTGSGTNTSLRTFLNQQARFVRIALDLGATSSGFGLYEVGIHGDAVTGQNQVSRQD